MIRADFSRLPFPNGSCDLVVAAFCLYHSRDPASIIAEIARCLVPGGTAIFAVKSADSYRDWTGSWPARGSTPQPRPGPACTRPPTAATSSHRRNQPRRPASHPRNPPVHLPHPRSRRRVPVNLTQVRPAARLAGHPPPSQLPSRRDSRRAGRGHVGRHLRAASALQRGDGSMTRQFVKRYPDTALAAGLRNTIVGSLVWNPPLVPELRCQPARTLLPARRRAARPPADLTILAAHLGDVHGSAHQGAARCPAAGPSARLAAM